MTPLDDPTTLAGKVSGSGAVLAVANTSQISLLPLVYKLKGATIQVAEKSFDADGEHFAAGSLLISNAADEGMTGRNSARLVSGCIATRRSAVRTGPRGHCSAHRVHAHLAWHSDGRLGGVTPSIPRAYPSITSARKPWPNNQTYAQNTMSSSLLRLAVLLRSKFSTVFPCGIIRCRGRNPSSLQTSAPSTAPLTSAPAWVTTDSLT